MILGERGLEADDSILQISFVTRIIPSLYPGSHRYPGVHRHSTPEAPARHGLLEKANMAEYVASLQQKRGIRRTHCWGSICVPLKTDIIYVIATAPARAAPRSATTPIPVGVDHV